MAGIRRVSNKSRRQWKTTPGKGAWLNRVVASAIGLRNRICFGYDVVRVRSSGQETSFMSSDHHEHGPPEVEPDEGNYSAIHQLIIGVAVFVVLSMVGVAVWLDAEIEHVTTTSVAGAVQE